MSLVKLYDIGDRLRLKAHVTDLDGADADPTTTICLVQLPSGNQSSPSVTHDSTGHYHADFDVSLSGLHVFKYTGSGAVVFAEEKEFRVRPQRVS